MPPFFISGVIHPRLVVVLLLGIDELPALDPSLTDVYVPCLAFWCLCINVKFPSTFEQHCNVDFIGFISSFLSRCCSVFLSTVSIDCDYMYLPHSSPCLPLLFQCVLISNVCGFADGFMKRWKETGTDSVVFRDGWWLVRLVITIASFWHESVCKDTNVHCGSLEHFKNKINRMLTMFTFHKEPVLKSVCILHTFIQRA